jgi:hypothetical protein
MHPICAAALPSASPSRKRQSVYCARSLGSERSFITGQQRPEDRVWPSALGRESPRQGRGCYRFLPSYARACFLPAGLGSGPSSESPDRTTGLRSGNSAIRYAGFFIRIARSYARKSALVRWLLLNVRDSVRGHRRWANSAPWPLVRLPAVGEGSP